MPKTIFEGDHEHLIEVLVEARKRASLTQKELAARLGRDQTFVSLIERRQRRLDVIEFVWFAQALQCDPSVLFGELVRRMKG